MFKARLGRWTGAGAWEEPRRFSDAQMKRVASAPSKDVDDQLAADKAAAAAYIAAAGKSSPAGASQRLPIALLVIVGSWIAALIMMVYLTINS